MDIVREQKVQEYVLFIEEGLLHVGSTFGSWNVQFNLFYRTPMEFTFFTPHNSDVGK